MRLYSDSPAELTENYYDRTAPLLHYVAIGSPKLGLEQPNTPSQIVASISDTILVTH